MSCSSYFFNTTLYFNSQHLIQISFENRCIGDVLNDITMNVDGMDFVMPCIGPKFFSHKFNDLALQYKVGIFLLLGSFAGKVDLGH